MSTSGVSITLHLILTYSCLNIFILVDVCVCVKAHHVCLGALKARKGIQTPGAVVRLVVSHLVSL